MRPMAITAALGLAAVLGACSDHGVDAPTDQGVCWHMVETRGQPPHFNRLSSGITSIEQCAANLEAMRLRFRGLGMTTEEMTGAYQGRFLFLRPSGVWVAPHLDSRPYLALVRTGDGRLATVGAVAPPPGPPPAQ